MARRAKEPEPAAESKRGKSKEKPEREEVVILQVCGREWNTAELRDQAVAAYVAKGHRASAIRRLELYVKPEENKAYYVVNGKARGSIDL